MKKKGQFFILAAVLIASVVFSLSIARNVLIGSETPQDFYLIGEQLDKEVKAVLDYDLVSGTNKTSSFINDSISYLNYSKPHTEIVFMYVKENNLTIENYADRDVNVSGFDVCSAGCPVAIGAKPTYPVNLTNVINLSMNGQSFYYNLSKGSKSYIVLMRNISREVYVDVKE
jgi:hypothetical protein